MECPSLGRARTIGLVRDGAGEGVVDRATEKRISCAAEMLTLSQIAGKRLTYAELTGKVGQSAV